LAELGHRVTVVDPSPDSLAALERRAAEAGVRVNAVQGDTRDLGDLLPEASAHLVLVHNVLEYVDDPLAALRDVVSVTRPGGTVSVMTANAVAAVLHRALAGHRAASPPNASPPWPGRPDSTRVNCAGCGCWATCSPAGCSRTRRPPRSWWPWRRRRRPTRSCRASPPSCTCSRGGPPDPPRPHCPPSLVEQHRHRAGEGCR